jgi:hypothetical protein
VRVGVGVMVGVGVIVGVAVGVKTGAEHCRYATAPLASLLNPLT